VFSPFGVVCLLSTEAFQTANRKTWAACEIILALIAIILKDKLAKCIGIPVILTNPFRISVL
jgi:hypothetical protein